METNYVVILPQRRHFGDKQSLFGDATFIDPDGSIFDGEFIFDCPNIDRGQTAVLMFQARDVDHEKNTFRINNQTVFGGLPKSPARENAKDSGWNSHVLLVSPVRHSLGDFSNRLMIVSRDSDGGINGNRDDFVVDNIVLFYKTRSNPAGIFREAISPGEFVRE